MSDVGGPSCLPSCATALIRLVRTPREVQMVVLLNIASICERQRVEHSLPISNVWLMEWSGIVSMLSCTLWLHSFTNFHWSCQKTSNSRTEYIIIPSITLLQTMFDPFLKSFFVRSSDSSFIRKLKLHILTSLVNETNVHIILRELKVRKGENILWTSVFYFRHIFHILHLLLML